MEPEPDVSNVTPFPPAQAFKQAATAADEHGVNLYAPQRIVTRTCQRMTYMSLDIMISPLIRIVVALPKSQEAEPDLGLILASIMPRVVEDRSRRRRTEDEQHFPGLHVNTWYPIKHQTGHPSSDSSARAYLSCFRHPRLCQNNLRCLVGGKGNGTALAGKWSLFGELRYE